MTTDTTLAEAARRVLNACNYAQVPCELPPSVKSALDQLRVALSAPLSSSANKRVGPHDYDGLVCKNCGERYGRHISTWCQNYPQDAPSSPPDTTGSAERAREELAALRADVRRHFENAATLTEERDALRAENARLRSALGFASSVIKSGEPWTATCERIIGSALAPPAPKDVATRF